MGPLWAVLYALTFGVYRADSRNMAAPWPHGPASSTRGLLMFGVDWRSERAASCGGYWSLCGFVQVSSCALWSVSVVKVFPIRRRRRVIGACVCAGVATLLQPDMAAV